MIKSKLVAGFRFRLRTVLVLMAVLGVALGLVTRELNNERRKKQAINEIVRLGGQITETRHPVKGSRLKRACNAIIGTLSDYQFYTEVGFVYFRPETDSDIDLLFAIPEVE